MPLSNDEDNPVTTVTVQQRGTPLHNITSKAQHAEHEVQMSGWLHLGQTSAGSSAAAAWPQHCQGPTWRHSHIHPLAHVPPAPHAPSCWHIGRHTMATIGPQNGGAKQVPHQTHSRWKAAPSAKS